MKMNYSLKEDINFIKEISNRTISDIADEIGFADIDIYRWIADPDSISKDNLELIYNYAYKKNIKLNLIKSHIYQEEYTSKGLKTLFHGSKNGIVGSKIDILLSSNNNDFGKGFYCGESYEQPASFVANYKNSSVYIFSFDDKNLNKLEFNVNNDWMLAIAYYRGYLKKYENSKIVTSIIEKIENADLIIAPIADNMMFDQIRKFTNGEYSDVQCQHCLSATNLGKQYVLKSNKAIDNLIFLDRCYLSETEKKQINIAKEDDQIISNNKIAMAISKYRREGKGIEELLNE